jgi:hypothetical protein
VRQQLEEEETLYIKNKMEEEEEEEEEDKAKCQCTKKFSYTPTRSPR